MPFYFPKLNTAAPKKRLPYNRICCIATTKGCMRKPVLFLLAILISIQGYTQALGSSYAQQTKGVQLYNIGTTALLTGISAVVTKKKQQRWLPAFAKGLAYGVAAGYLKCQGKNLLQYVNYKQSLGYNWLSQMVFAAGESISENASANIDPWKRWYIPVYFFRAKIDFRPNKRRFGLLLDPVQVPSICYEFLAGHQLDAGLTLRSGVFMFNSAKRLRANGFDVAGYASPSTVTYNSGDYSLSQKSYKYQVFAHEMVHNRQAYDFTGVRGFYNKLSDWEDKHFFNIYLNPSPLISNGLYAIEGRHPVDQYYRNYFEFEAEYFATKQQVIIK